MPSSRKIVINSCFAFRDAKGEQHYVTPADNADDVAELIPSGKIDAFVKSGVLSVITSDQE